MIAQYTLVRRKSKPFEENMIAGKSDKNGVRCYAFSDEHKEWRFTARIPESELKVVGAIGGKQPRLVG